MSADGIRNGLLSDSEATLRQVRGVLREFASSVGDRYADLDHAIEGLEEQPVGLGELVKILVTTRSEIMEIIESLRHSRGLLELQEVTSRQLGCASGVLYDVEERMQRLSQLFDAGIGPAGAVPARRISRRPAGSAAGRGTCGPGRTGRPR